MTSGFDVGNAYGRIVIDASGVEAAVNQAKATFAQGFAQMGQGISDLGGALTGLSLPLSALGGFGLNAASDFDSAMTEISARTGLVGDDLENIRQVALQMGADTVFSAQDAADAFLNLLASGQTTEQALATLPAVLEGAAASGASLGQTSDVVTSVLAAFALQANDASGVVDALARASAASKADMMSLGQGFSNVGPVARQFGLSVEQTAAMLAIFANNGIQGAEAGTQLKSMLLNMNRPVEEVQGTWDALGLSLYDADGNMRDMTQVIAELDAALDQMPVEQQNEIMQTLAGSYGIVGLAALRAGVSIDDMQAQMADQTGSAEMAAAMMNTFKNRIESARGSVETLMINALTPFMNDVLTPMINRIIEVVNQVNEWVLANPELTSQIVKISAAFVALGPALMGVGQGMRMAGLLMGALTSPIGLIVAAVTGLKLAFDENFLGIRDLLGPIIQQVIGGFNTLIGVFGQFGEIVASGGIGSAIDYVINAFAQMLGLVATDEFFAPLRGIGDTIVGVFEGIVGFVQGTVMPALQAFGAWLAGIWALVGPALGQLEAWFIQDVLPQVGAIITDRIMPALQSMGEFLLNIWNIVSPALTQFAAWFLQDGLPAIQNTISNVVLPVIDAFFAVIAGIWEFVRPGLEQFAAWFVQDALPGVIGFLQTTVQPFLDAFFGFIAGVWDLVSPALSALFGWFAESGLPIIQAEIERVWNGVLKPFIELLAGIWSAVSAGVTDFFNWFTISGLPVIRGAIEFFMNNIVRPLINLLSGIWNAVKGGVEAFKNGIMNFLQPIIDLIEGLIGKLNEVKGAMNAGADGRDYAGGQIAAMQAGGQQITAEQLRQQMWQSTLAQTGGNDLMARAIFPRVEAEAMKDPTMAAILRGRAAGGPVQRNVPYIVGERGPEMFVPEGSGHIVPNHAMGSGVQIGNITIHANSDAEGRAAALGFQRQLEEVMRANG